MKNSYSAFEERYRGDRDLVKSRLQPYLPFVNKLIEHSTGPLKVIDLGCGRGEWIEILGKLSAEAIGVDLDESMLLKAQNLGLSVKKKDVIEALKELPDQSLSIVSAFQLIEHLPFKVLTELIDESYRVLRPEGMLIIETPNYENIDVAIRTFYLDPSHIAPVPYELIEYVLSSSGFLGSVKLLLNEDKKFDHDAYVSLSSVISGAARDYGVIAFKSSFPNMDLPCVANDFKTLRSLSDAFDNQIHRSNELLHALNGVVHGLQKQVNELTKDLIKLKSRLKRNGRH